MVLRLVVYFFVGDGVWWVITFRIDKFRVRRLVFDLEEFVGVLDLFIFVLDITRISCFVWV